MFFRSRAGIAVLTFSAMRACLFAVVIAMPILAFAQELPKSAPAKPSAKDASLLPDDNGDPLFPKLKLSDSAFLKEIEPAPSVEQAKAAVDQAERKEQRWQKLFKSGVVAKVEVERATLQVARLRAKLERARVAEQESALAELRAKTGTSPDVVASAESALQTAKTILGEAEAALRRTELMLAEVNVERQRQLLKMGAGSKAVLQRAEAALAQLRQAAPAP